MGRGEDYWRLTYAVPTIKVVTLLAICIELTRAREDGELSSTCWSERPFDVFFNAVEISIENARLALASEKD